MLTTPLAASVAPVASAARGWRAARGRRAARGWRAVPLAVTAVAATGLLTSCASAASTASAPKSTATPGTVRSSASTDDRAASSGTPGLAACGSGSLRVTVNAAQSGAAAGSAYVPVDFTNTSGAACGMYGYPGMSFVTANGTAGQQIGAAAQRNPQFGDQPVRLAAGGVAHAWLQVAEAGNYPPSACKPVTAHWLRVFAPGQTAASYVNHPFDACSSANAPLLTVMPIRAGRGVQGTTP
jgi:hypothetical protein